MYILTTGGPTQYDKKPRLSTGEKIRTVLQTFNPQTSMTEICHEHNLVPRTAYVGKEKFLDGWYGSFGGSNVSKQTKTYKKRDCFTQENRRRVCCIQRCLKKKRAGERARVNAVRTIHDVMGLNKPLLLCGVSKWHNTF